MEASLQEDLRLLRSEVIPNGDAEVPLPINLSRLIHTAQGLFGTSRADDSDFGPTEIITGVQQLLDKLVVVPGKDALSQEAQRNATLLLFAHIRSSLASKRVCCCLWPEAQCTCALVSGLREQQCCSDFVRLSVSSQLFAPPALHCT
jgi:hypothetical protein